MLENYLYKNKVPLQLIGDLIPRNKTTLLHGRSGCGKTFSILKFFKKENIVPILLDFDDNDTTPDITHVDGDKFIEALSLDSSLYSELKGQIIIIDTYVTASASFKKHLDCTVKEFVDSLDATIIVVAHTVYYSGKPAEASVPFEFANHVSCRLHLHNDVKMTKINDYLEIEKLRGIGSFNIHNWMR